MFFRGYLLLVVCSSLVAGVTSSKNASASDIASERFSIESSERTFLPIKKGKFLRSERERLNDSICKYAISQDFECAMEESPPCQKLVPIAFNFCRSELYRQMHPQVISRSESRHWTRKFKKCIYAATKALVTNPERQERFCHADEGY